MNGETMKLALDETEAQLVVDALINHIRHKEMPPEIIEKVWVIVSEMATKSHRRRKVEQWRQKVLSQFSRDTLTWERSSVSTANPESGRYPNSETN